MEVGGGAEAVPIRRVAGGFLAPPNHRVDSVETCVGDVSLNRVEPAVVI